MTVPRDLFARVTVELERFEASLKVIDRPGISTTKFVEHCLNRTTWLHQWLMFHGYKYDDLKLAQKAWQLSLKFKEHAKRIARDGSQDPPFTEEA